MNAVKMGIRDLEKRPERFSGKSFLKKKYLFKYFFIMEIAFMGLRCFSAPAMKIPLIANEPVIDGKIASGEWKNAACASGFISIDNEWPLLQTSAYLAVKGQYLYFTFECQCLDSDKLKAGKYEKDSTRIFGEESVEFFLAPEVAGNSYYHMAFNAAGSSYTAKCGDRRDTGWVPELEFKTGRSAKSWIIEGRLALASVGADNTVGTKWKVNFGRNNRISGRQISSWTGQRNFNDKDLMGSAEISKEIFVDYSLEDLGALSGVKVILRNHQPKKAECKVTAVYTGKDFVYSCSVKPGNQESICSPPFAEASGKNITLKISGKNFKYEKSAFLPFYRKFSVIPDFYYLTSPFGKLNVKIDNKIENTSAIKVSLYSSGNKKPLRQIELKTAETAFDVDLKNLPCGRYVLSAQLFDENGKEVADDDRLIFIKKSPEFSSLPEKQDIKIKGSALFMNDAPFFPFMISSPAPNIPACFNVKFAKTGNKENSPERGSCGVPARLRRKPFLFRELPNEETTQKKTIDFIEKTSDKKYLYRCIQYEAQIPFHRLTKNGLEPVANAAEYCKIYNLIKKEYPETLTSIQVDDLAKVKDYADYTDIIEAASWRSSYATNPFNNLAADIRNVREQAGGKPLIWWLGASIPSQDARTAEKIRGAAYLAIMNGVNGMIFHNGHGGVPASRTRLWSVFPELARELEFLYPLIEFGEKVTGKNIEVKPAEIKFIVRRIKGKLYIIALNPAPVTVRGDFVLPGIHDGKIKVLFENRETELKNGKFADDFTPYEPHVYMINIK